LDELFNFFLNTIDTTLRPQRSRDYEAGIRARYNERSGLNVNFFYIETQDEIFFDPVNFLNTNLDGTTRRTGLELYLYAGLGILDLSAGYTYTDSEILEGQYAGSVVPGVPAQRMTLTGRVSLGRGFSLSANGVYVGQRPFIGDFANTFSDQEDYFVMNAKLKYERGPFSLFIDLNNLTGAEYSEYGVLGGFPVEEAIYPSPEFNALAGLALNF
ncbi:MAG: TonB-dependent receptor, partial [Myxococcota bacterium]